MFAAKDLEFREHIPFALNMCKLNGIGIEIGVQNAEFTKHMLTYWDCEKYYCIDVWHSQAKEIYEDIANVNEVEMQMCFIKSVANIPLKAYPKVTFLQLYSEQACVFFSNNYFDFIYIDANHAYEYVKKDIEIWYPKLRLNGMMAGHDYQWEGVNKAVKESFSETVFSTTDNNNWYLYKGVSL